MTAGSECAASLLKIAADATAANAAAEGVLLERLWAAVHGSAPRRNRGGRNPENSFVSKLDAEAYESAVIMLLPFSEQHGRPWFWRMGHGSENPGWAHINRRNGNHCDRDDESTGWAKTPCLAMIIAIASARAVWLGRRG